MNIKETTQAVTEVTKKNLTETEAASEYGGSVHWYRRARWKGDGPKFIKLSGMVLYPRTELDAFFASRMVKSTSEASCRKSSITGRA
jgi:hypothetical protein